MILELIELILKVRSADQAMRDKSRVGESGLDREARRFVNKLCFGAIALVVLVPVVWIVCEAVF